MGLFFIHRRKTVARRPYEQRLISRFGLLAEDTGALAHVLDKEIDLCTGSLDRMVQNGERPAEEGKTGKEKLDHEELPGQGPRLLQWHLERK
jgi:hypothetical protein